MHRQHFLTPSFSSRVAAPRALGPHFYMGWLLLCAGTCVNYIPRSLFIYHFAATYFISYCCSEPTGSLAGLYVHDDFAKDVLNVDASTLLQTLTAKYSVAPNDNVPAFQVQLVKGDHPALNARSPVKGGSPMPRHKFFFQTGDPVKDGILKYGYTGRHARVSLLTADVAQCPEVAAILEKYNRWVAAEYEGTHSFCDNTDVKVVDMLCLHFSKKLARCRSALSR
eukprot:SAG25_NODE_269_length_10643_cov_3.370982_2_plen_224_part_00